MENWIQAVPAIFLMAALLAATAYVLRHWPDSRDKLAHDLGWLNNAIKAIVPGLSTELGRLRRRFRNELSRIFPLWSAATTENREAEFIHDRLPARFPFWAIVLAAVVLAGLAWWITR
jgi:hypothetical protein